MTDRPSRHDRSKRRRRISLLTDTGGAAAVEFVLWLAILIVPILSAVDISFYAYQRMQLEIAARAGAQAAWKACDTSSKWPAVKNCAGMLSTIQLAAQSTTLSTGVTVPSSAVTEGYYCANSSNQLVLVGTTATIGGTPTGAANCSSVTTGSTAAPGDYLFVTASYSYAPLFTGVSIASLLTTPITRTAWVRLN